MSQNNTNLPPPRKRWGQNFLTDDRAIDRIVAAVGSPGGDRVIEIGPGRGALTRRLVAAGFELEAWEIDPQLVPLLENELGASVVVRNVDALEADLPTEPFRAVGNLPYNVANPIIRRLLWSGYCSRAVFMVQREVADRYTAEPGSPDWGYLGASTRLVATPSRLLNLKPGAFHPRPKVESAVVVFEPHNDRSDTSPAVLDRLLSAAFRQRRKTLANNLTGFDGLSKKQATEIIEKAGLTSSVRAEQIDLAQFGTIQSLLDS